MAQSFLYPFKPIPLPSYMPYILNMYEDHQGFLWLGTEEGLYRYDGEEFKAYTSKDLSNGLALEVIKYIFEDKANNLWIGSQYGLHLYNRSTQDFTTYRNAPEMFVEYIYEEEDGKLFVATKQGLFHFVPRNKSFIQLHLKDNPSTQFGKLRNKEFLYLAQEGSIRAYNMSNHTYTSYELPQPHYREKDAPIYPYEMCMDKDNNLWINTWHAAVYKIELNTGKVSYYTDKANAKGRVHLLDKYNPSLFTNDDGKVWLASHIAGINIFDTKENNIAYLPLNDEAVSSLAGNYMLMHKSRRNIWVKTSSALYILNKSISQIDKLTQNQTKITGELNTKIIFDHFAFTMSYHGPFITNTKTGVTKKINHTNIFGQNSSNTFIGVYDAYPLSNNHILLATQQGIKKCLFTFSDSSFDLKTIEHIPIGTPALEIFKMTTDLLLLRGSTNGKTFSTYDLVSKQVSLHDFADTIAITELLPYDETTALICVRNKGLFLYDLNKKVLTKKIFDNHKITGGIDNAIVLKASQFANGCYGFATENRGFFYADFKRNTLHHFDIASIAKTNKILGFHEDAKGDIWLQTPKNIFKYERSTNKLVAIDYNALFQDQHPFLNLYKEKFYLVYNGFLYSLPLKNIFVNLDKPKLYFSGIEAESENLDYLQKKITLNSAINTLTFDFICMSNYESFGNRYSYKIEGLHHDWQQLGNKSELTLTNLLPGKYRLLFSAQNGLSVSSEILYSPLITILPPFYKSWWFIVLMLCLMSSIVYYFYKLRHTKKLAAEKIRSQISRDLHDDLGSTLSGVKMYTQVMEQMIEQNEDVRPIVKEISSKTDAMMYTMSDIVWSINPSKDSLNDIMVRLKTYMAEVLESKNIDVLYTQNCDLKPFKIQPQYKKDLYLLLKEVIHNASKHAACTVFYFDVSVEKNNLTITINDNGKGFDINQKNQGNGLLSIKERAAAMRGKLEIQSNEGSGTKYILTVKL